MDHRIQPHLNKLLTNHLTTDIPARVNRDFCTRVTNTLHKGLTHILSRSVAHSIVPSLVHTVSHSAYQDYYCYYCFYDKAYCQYCHYSPLQVYYALFYTQVRFRHTDIPTYESYHNYHTAGFRRDAKCVVFLRVSRGQWMTRSPPSPRPAPPYLPHHA